MVHELTSQLFMQGMYSSVTLIRLSLLRIFGEFDEFWQQLWASNDTFVYLVNQRARFDMLRRGHSAYIWRHRNHHNSSQVLLVEQNKKGLYVSAADAIYECALPPSNMGHNRNKLVAVDYHVYEI